MTREANDVQDVITVIIVSWNVREYVEECLRALLRFSSGLSLQVIVVDNGSADGTVQMVREQYPKIELIALPTNVGFPAANNVAIRRAIGRYVLLLNPDTVVQEGCLQRCIKALAGDATVGMSGCRLIYPDGAVQYECAASLPSLWDVPIEAFYLHMLLPRNPVFGRLRMSYWDHMSDRLVPRISGAFMMIRSDVLAQVGMMDERIFMYYEDIDLCARVTEAGWRIQYVSDAITVHYGGRSAALSSLALDELAPQVRFTYFLDHKGRHYAYVYRALCVIQSAIRIAIALVLVGVLPPNAQLRKRPVSKVGTHWRRLLWSIGLAEMQSYRGNGRAGTVVQ